MNLLIGKSFHESRVFRRCSIPNPKSRRRFIRSSKKLTRMLFFASIYFLVTGSLTNESTTKKIETGNVVTKKYILAKNSIRVSFLLLRINRRRLFGFGIEHLRNTLDSWNDLPINKFIVNITMNGRIESITRSTNA
jgi:hypothetical protein